MTEISSLSEVGLTVRQTQTKPKNPNKAPKDVWEVRGATTQTLKGYADIIRDLGGRWWQGAYSFFSDPTEKLIEAINDAGGKRSYDEKLEVIRERAEDRADWLEERADKAQAGSNAAYARVKQIGDGIPMGQPILVGHHSEGRHRADIKRMDNGMRKTIELSDKADHLQSRADAAARSAEGNHSIRYMASRVDEAEAAIRDCVRKLEKYPESGEWRERMEIYKAEQEEKAAYWKAQIEAAGGVKHSPDTVKKGGYIKYRGTWYPVNRVNKKTVTIGNWLNVERLTFGIPYSEVSDFRGADQ